MKKSMISLRFAVGSVVAGLFLAGITSCGKRDQNSPGFEFMPDMYRSPSLEYYSTHTIDGDTVYNAMLPVKGTIARGFMPYPYANNSEGYEAAGANLKNPLPMADRAKWEAEGEVIYGKFCIQCHGATGAGDGKVGQKLPGAPPAYDGALKTLPEGKIFHSITYGKGMMGAHAPMLTTEERWKLVCYVQKLQGPPVQAAPADSVKTATAAK